MQVRSIHDLSDIYPSQQAIASLYRPPISQQAVNRWFQEERVPLPRIARLLRDIRRRGYDVKAAALNADAAQLI
jgi:hypothetical protein